MKKIVLFIISILFITWLSTWTMPNIPIVLSFVTMAWLIVEVIWFVVIFVFTYKKRKFINVLEKAREHKLNKRFIDKAYKDYKFKGNIDKKALSVIKVDAKKSAHDTTFKFNTQINKAKEKNNKVTLITKIKATKLSEYILYRKTINIDKIKYNL